MKRRVIKVSFRRYRVELPGGDINILTYGDKPRAFDSELEQFIDFGLGEERYDLVWDGIYLESFVREAEVISFIIRFAYSMKGEHLIPSEILADFNWIYEGGDWVDEWECPDWHEITPALGPIIRPFDRKLRFEDHRITVDERLAFDRQEREGDNDASVRSMLARHARSKVRSFGNWRTRRPPRKLVIPKLDFAILEAPRRRRRAIAWDWREPFGRGFEHWNQERARRQSNYDRLPDEECLFVLKSGAEASEPKGPKKPREPKKGRKRRRSRKSKKKEEST